MFVGPVTLRRWMVLFAAFVPALAGAQRWTGVVRDSASGAPITNVSVSLLGAGNVPIAMVRTNAQGRFAVSGNAPRVITFRRLGYYPRDVSLADRGDVVDVVMTHITADLDAIVVGAEQCRPDYTRAQAEQLWLQATEMWRVRADTTNEPRISAVVFALYRPASAAGLNASDLTTQALVIGKEFPRASDLLRVRPPPLRANETENWVTSAGIYYPPGPELLFDRAFMRSHCFGIAPRLPDSPRGQIGVAFTAWRTFSDRTAGVLWLDTVEYLPQLLTTRSPAGTMTFRSAPNGYLLVDTWQIETGKDRVRGTALQSAEWSDGTRLETTKSLVRGRVLDPRTSLPRAGVQVGVGDWSGTTSSADGFFTLGVPLAYRYGVTARDTTYQAFGLTTVSSLTTIDSRSQGAATPVRIPTPLDSARRRCTGGTFGNGAGVVLVRLLDADLSRAVNTRLVLTDSITARRVSETRTPRGTTTGFLTVCGATRGNLAVQATDVRGRVGNGTVRITGGAVIDTLTVYLRPPPR